MATTQGNFDQKYSEEEKEQETYDEGKYKQLDFLLGLLYTSLKCIGSVWSNLYDVSGDISQVHDDIQSEQRLGYFWQSGRSSRCGQY